MTAVKTISETDFSDLARVHRGKVRDVYQVGDARLLLAATDRISAFDCVIPTAIPRKGEILTALSCFWFARLEALTKNHLITENFDEMPEIVRRHEQLRGRSILVKKTKVFPVECIVRGYLAGSGWKDYQATGEICGHRLPEGLREAERLPRAIFTPATKAAAGHDENIDEREFERIIGAETAAHLRAVSLELYEAASEFALTRGIIIADTKFEFGADEAGNILLIDEILTPDSSRFWAKDTYAPGGSPPSFDKQFVRDYLETLDWNKQPPAPELPPEIVAATVERYLGAYKILTGKDL